MSEYFPIVVFATAPLLVVATFVAVDVWLWLCRRGRK